MLQDHREQLIEKKIGKTNSFCSSWENILSVAPQGSILGPLLLKIYVHYIFLILKTSYFTAYADGSMPFMVGDDTTDALKALKRSATISKNGFQITRCSLIHAIFQAKFFL